MVAIAVAAVALGGLAMPPTPVQAATQSASSLMRTWSAGYATTTVQDGWQMLRYRGSWYRSTYGRYLGGHARTSIRQGSTVTLQFNGTAVSWIGPVGPRRGKAIVYLDGRQVKVVDTRAATFSPARVLYKVGFASFGTHRLTIKVANTGRRHRVAVDAFVVREKPRVRTTVVPPPIPADRSVTFWDDFGGSAPDSSKWSFDGEWGCCGLSKESDLMNGGGVSVANGIMTLSASRGSTPSGRAWRSSEIATKGHFSQLYGNFQARMRWTKGDGLWPAFWLLQSNASGRRPELDVMEAYPNTSNWPGKSAPWPGVSRYQFTNHYDSVGGHQGITIEPGADLTAGWHVYEMEWRPNLLIARFDGREVGRMTNNAPSVPMFMILDMVVGNWSQLSTSSTPDVAHLQVDWVRVTD
jgi:beta-glucanase (GH16 family)